MKRGELILPMLLGGGFAICLIEVSGYRWQVSVAPALACGLGLGLALILIARTVLSSGSLDPAPDFGAEDIAQFGWFALALLAVVLLGFAVGGGIYVFLHVLFVRNGAHRLVVALLCAAAVPLVVFGVFRGVLQIHLFGGLITVGPL